VHSLRTLPTQRSAIAFACGARAPRSSYVVMCPRLRQSVPDFALCPMDELFRPRRSLVAWPGTLKGCMSPTMRSLSGAIWQIAAMRQVAVFAVIEWARRKVKNLRH
jgi:hypothetical protein